MAEAKNNSGFPELQVLQHLQLRASEVAHSPASQEAYCIDPIRKGSILLSLGSQNVATSQGEQRSLCPRARCQLGTPSLSTRRNLPWTEALADETKLRTSRNLI